jgi:hypothetical protein
MESRLVAGGPALTTKRGRESFSLPIILRRTPDPIFYDNDDSGRGYSGWTPSYDERYYQYAPQTDADYDERLVYPPETNASGSVVLDGDGNPNCDYVYDDGTHGAQSVEGPRLGLKRQQDNGGARAARHRNRNARTLEDAKRLREAELVAETVC